MASPFEYAIKPLKALLDDPQIAEICINKPGEAWSDRHVHGWEKHTLSELDIEFLWDFATTVAGLNHKSISNDAPLFSGSLPTGERIHIITPPACIDSQFGISIRKQTIKDVSIDELVRRGFFNRVRTKPDNTAYNHLCALIEKEDWPTFCRQAVKLKQNIILAGSTYTGKTTTMNAFIKEIPLYERLIIIEDSVEVIADHPNILRLLYSDEDGSNRSADNLLKACMRMRPDRLMMSEIKGPEAFTYLNSLFTGHKGSITTVHAGSPAETFERLAFLVMQEKSGFTEDMARNLAKNAVDCVLQIDREDNKHRFLDEVWIKDAV